MSFSENKVFRARTIVVIVALAVVYGIVAYFIYFRRIYDIYTVHLLFSIMLILHILILVLHVVSMNLNRKRIKYSEIGDDMVCGRVIVNLETREIEDANKCGLIMLKMTRNEIIGSKFDDYFEEIPNDQSLINPEMLVRKEIYGEISEYENDEENSKIFQSAMTTKGGEKIPVFILNRCIKHQGKLYSIFSFLDISAYMAELEEKKELEAELMHNDKLYSIGMLAAGIAHEINSPVQFVGNNINFLNNSMNKMMSMVEEIEEIAMHPQNDHAETKKMFNEIKEKNKYDFLCHEIPLAIQQSEEGVDRITKIVGNMKDFSHVGSQELSKENINQAIESTVMITKNEWKYCADVKLDLEKQLPLVMCVMGDIKQVVLNLIINAAHAIRERGEDGKGLIKISTISDDEYVYIKIKDTGCGIQNEHYDSVFNPFFTTKKVGVGTGQGLSISQHIIVEKHNGKIFFESNVGQGTEFTIKLPIDKKD